MHAEDILHRDRCIGQLTEHLGRIEGFDTGGWQLEGAGVVHPQRVLQRGPAGRQISIIASQPLETALLVGQPAVAGILVLRGQGRIPAQSAAQKGGPGRYRIGDGHPFHGCAGFDLEPYPQHIPPRMTACRQRRHMRRHRHDGPADPIARKEGLGARHRRQRLQRQPRATTALMNHLQTV